MVGVMGVITAITVPLIADAMDRYEVISASQQVASTVRSARFQAVARNQVLEVQFDLEAGEYRVFEDGGVTPVGELQRLPTGVSFDAGSAVMVEIQPTGRVTGAATITVSNGNEVNDRTITVSTSGRVQLQ